MANDIILSRVDMDVKKSEALASSASSEGRAYKCVMENALPLQFVKPSNLSVLVVVVRAQPLASSLLGFPELQERHGVCGNHDFVIHGFTSVGRANHYMPSLKAGSIVKVDRFEVSRCSSMYKITDHPFLIRFISLTIIDEVITGAPEINLQSRLDSLTISK
ncbi:hypothetical protein YC2023_051617 [Brassica napus]